MENRQAMLASRWSRICCMTVKGNRLVLFFYALLALGYFIAIFRNFIEAYDTSSIIFGYADYMHQWRILDDFVNLRMPFVDYIHRASYGLFYMLIQSPPYLILGRTFFAILSIRHIYLPIIGVILSFVIARNVLGRHRSIILFLFFCLLFGSNYIYESPRHLMAELSLSFLILYFIRLNTKHLLLSGLVAGLSIMTSFEYGLVVNLSVVLTILTSVFFDYRKIPRLIVNFAVGEAIILAPYFSWLFSKGVLSAYLNTTLTSISKFHYLSPASGASFPRLSDISKLPGLSFETVIPFLQRLNMYLFFVFFALTGVVLLIRLLRNSAFRKNDMVKLALVVYGLGVFSRTMDTPAVGYFVYGLVPFFLLLAIVVDEFTNKKGVLMPVKIGCIGIIFSWLIITQNTGIVQGLFDKKNHPTIANEVEKAFYGPAGLPIEKKYADYFSQTTDYIKSMTNENDLVYVYPWGIFNITSGRRSASMDPLPGADYGEKEKIVQELEKNTPKFVIVSLVNNGSVAHFGKSRGDVARYISIKDADGPVFAGEGNPIDEYILENYEPVTNNVAAIVMSRRSEPIRLEPKEKETYAVWPV